MVYRALYEVILIKVSFDIQSISYCNQRIISDIPSTSCSHLYTRDVLIYKTHVCLVVTITPLMIHQWYIWPDDKYLIK